MPIFKGKPSPGNLPAPLSSFIGREHEIRDIRQLLSANRLVTLTGPGGCGKTRLALEVAYKLLGEFEHGIWFVELATVADPEFVPQTIAATLNVREQSKQPLAEVLADSLGVAPTLLVLDNCEHLILACAQIAETLLKKCPELTILVTSREVMGLTGEVAWLVPPMSLPDQQPWTHIRGARQMQ
jgi:predicted ATPase